MLNTTLEQIKIDEGLRLELYKCPAGKSTIGYGRNLEDRGITLEEADFLLSNDIRYIQNKLLETKIDFDKLNPIRQSVLINMAYQMGISGLFKFKKMFVALSNQDYNEASLEMLDSRWAKQTPDRANRLANLMKRGY